MTANINNQNLNILKHLSEIQKDIGDTFHTPSSREILYQNDIKALVIRPQEQSIFRKYCKRNEIVFAYADSNDIWYPAPILILNSDQKKVIYHADIPRESDSSEHIPSKDRLSRKYFLIPANKGYVPVRHGTDPILNNWLSPDSRIKIVYDSHCVRHPAAEGVDYATQGFEFVGGRIWWPLLNGKFNKTFKRIKDPYFENYAQLFVPEPTRAGLLARMAVLSASVGGVGLAAATQQVVSPEVNQEALAHGRAQDRRRTEFQLQKNIMDLLNTQDSLDLSQEIAQKLQTNSPFKEIETLISQNANISMLSEHRGKIARQAAISGKTRELELILKTGPISNEDRGQALLDSVNGENLPCTELLLKDEALIPDEFYTQAVIKAAKLGAVAILPKLLTRQILPEARGQAVIEAVERGSERDIDLLFESGPISIEKRGEAAIAACRQRIAIFQKIMKNGSILVQYRGEAAIESVKNGNFEHMRLLIADSISMEHRGQAAIIAAKNGNIEIMKELSANGPISLHHKVEAARIINLNQKT